MVGGNWSNRNSLGGVAACSDIPPEYKPFFRLSPREMEKAIFDYPLDQQIDLMIIGLTIPHPPFMMWPEVASNGEKILPLLFTRLTKVDDPHQLDVILACLLEVDLRHYEWKRDPKYQQLLQQKLEEMTDSTLRDEATRSLVQEAAFFRGQSG